MNYYLGIDIGTLGTKVLMVDITGAVVAEHTSEYDLSQPHNGWAEQDPLLWWNATVEGIKAVLPTVKAEDVKGIGFSGQMHGLVMLDKNGDVIRPAILWCDTRTGKECDQITQLVGKERLIEITANPALAGFTASKIMWVKNNEPENYNKCCKILLPKDYIRYKLCDVFATEVSSNGYGFLWNNPAHGRATFAKNVTLWTAVSTKFLDYWICAGDSPKEISQQYATATGKTPMMPENAMGFWQCKLRYRTQEELLEVAREYKKRGLPLDVIVVDFFHWPFLGDFKFNEKFWPDPDAMIKEINDMGTQVVVSIWPFIEDKSENYREMREKGYLVTSERGLPFSHTYIGNSIPFDATNPDARKYVWEKAKKNYYDKGVRIFWLDEAEPEFEVYDFENYRYSIGPVVQSGNIYPSRYAQGFYEGRKAEGETEILNLIRCAWAGSQKYGTLVWSGDVRSSFDSFKQQICAGLNMAMSGISWWTTDIGGFFGGNVNDPEFRELLVRWFQYGTFCPVMRLHGDRQPKFPGTGLVGGEKCGSGSPNEVWSYREDVYKILKPYLFIREAMKPYIKKVMMTAHTDGDPVMRPLFYEFPEDKSAWDVEDSFMFGEDILVCPVTDYNQREKTVYLPQGAGWTDVWSGKKYDGGQWVTVSAPLEKLPLFARDDFDASFITKAFSENY